MTKKPLPVLVSTEDLEARTRSIKAMRSLLGVEGSDVLARLSRVRSDYAADFPAQAVSRDPFVDDTGTGYGGMKWMAPIEGNWRAENGLLTLVSSMHRSLVESTQIIDTFNGSAQISFTLNDHTRKEYGGIAFRLLDKDNYFYAFYDIESDTIQICKNVASGVDTVLATSAVMNWTAGGVKHYLRVVTRYALVHVYTSSDGITWTELAWASGSNEIPGMSLLDDTHPYTNWSGKFAVLGKGYSDIDAPPSWEPVPWPEPVLPPANIGSNVGETWLYTTTGIFWSGDFFNGGQPGWNKVKDGLPQAGTPSTMFRLDNGELFVVYYNYVTANTGLWRCQNPKDEHPVWTELLSSSSPPHNTLRITAVSHCAETSTFHVHACNGDVDGQCAYSTHWGYYNGATITWKATHLSNVVPVAAYMLMYTGNAGGRGLYYLKNTSYSTISSHLVNTTDSPIKRSFPGAPAWRYADGRYIALVSQDNGATVRLVNPLSFPDSQTGYVASGPVIPGIGEFNWTLRAHRVTGSQYGNRAFVVDRQGSWSTFGKFYIGTTDAVTYCGQLPSLMMILDAKSTGGGSLVSLLERCDEYGVFIRINRDGTGGSPDIDIDDSWQAMTGDFWTTLGETGSKTFLGMQLVYT